MTDKKKIGDDADRETAETARAEADAAAVAAAEEALADTDQDGETVDDDFSPEDHIAELEAELAKAKDQMLRALAEAENTRRRADRDRQEAAKYGAVGLARDLLSVSDNLRRALQALPEEARDGDSWAKAGIPRRLRKAGCRQDGAAGRSLRS
jgi:molecular chaperone GrpE